MQGGIFKNSASRENHAEKYDQNKQNHVCDEDEGDIARKMIVRTDGLQLHYTYIKSQSILEALDAFQAPF